MAPWLVFLAILSLAQQVLPPRDTPRSPSATGVVRGRITSAASGAPLHRVRVTLNGPVPNAPAAVTDTQGNFEITDVPPGSYTLTAVRAGYLTIQYGQRRPREIGRTIEVRAGLTIDKLEMALPRGGVFAGRITDELGDPAPGVRVEALEYRYIRGRRVQVPARLTITNDIGEYRLSGLEPGSYRLRASSDEVWESDDEKTTHAFVVTYFPGVTGADAPQVINLEQGQEIAGLDLRLLSGIAARVTGIVEDANGQPLPDQVVYLSTVMRTIGGRLLGSGQGAPPTRTGARGAFEFAGLAPGEYLVGSGGNADRVSETVVLNEGDVRHVRLTPRPPAEITGAITTDEGAPPPFVASRIRVQAVPTDPERVLPLWGESGGITVRPDWTFRTSSLDGPHLFRVMGLPLDWMLEAVRIGDREITDVPLTIVPGGEGLKIEVVLSRKGALITGEVATAGGTPAQDVTIVVFSEDSTHWRSASRYVHATRPDDRGHFSVPRLPSGRYRVIAATAVLDGQWEDAAFLQSHMQRGLRVDVVEGLVERIKLTVGAER